MLDKAFCIKINDTFKISDIIEFLYELSKKNKLLFSTVGDIHEYSTIKNYHDFNVEEFTKKTPNL